MEKFHQKNKEYNMRKKEERIKELLKDLEKTMENIDEFSVQKIDELTTELERLQENQDDFDRNKAKEEFFSEYLPLVAKKQNEKTIGKNRVKRKVKVAAILAAVFLCLGGSTVAIAGLNIFEAIFKTNSDIFHINVDGFLKNKSEIISQDGTTWEDLETEMGKKIPVIGYFVETLQIGQMDVLFGNMAIVEFLDGNDVYTYTVQDLERGSMERVIEKDDEEISVITLDDIEYHIIQNRKWITIIWQKDNQLFTITGNLDESEAISTIESIRY